MEGYKNRVVKAANTWLIVFVLICALYYVFSAYMLYISAPSANKFFNLDTVINLLIAVLIYLYYKTLAEPLDKRLKRRLIPLSFVPFTVLCLISGVISSLIEAFPLVRIVPASVADKNTFVKAVVAAVSLIISAVVTLPIQKKITVRYIDIFFPESNIVFPKQYGIKRKWYFGIVSSLIVSAVFSVFTTGTAFIRNVELKNALTGVIGALQTAALALVTYLLFNAVFKNIDKSYRRLFYPFMTVDYIVGKVFMAVYTPFSVMLNISGFNYNGDMDSIIALMPRLAFMFAFGVAELILSALFMIKLLGEFEEK